MTNKRQLHRYDLLTQAFVEALRVALRLWYPENQADSIDFTESVNLV